VRGIAAPALLGEGAWVPLLSGRVTPLPSVAVAEGASHVRGIAAPFRFFGQTRPREWSTFSRGKSSKKSSDTRPLGNFPLIARFSSRGTQYALRKRHMLCPLSIGLPACVPDSALKKGRGKLPSSATVVAGSGVGAFVSWGWMSGLDRAARPRKPGGLLPTGGI